MPTNTPILSTRKDAFKVLASFVVLFGLYHAAEYMILFRNNALAFLALQAVFFAAAWLLGRWCRGNGLEAWGLPFSGRVGKLLLAGVLLGLALYAVPYFVGLAFGIETIVKVPDAATIIRSSLPFAFGVIFSSFSEDVLTRGVVYRFLHGRVAAFWIVVISAAVYLLNHIYRLNDGPDTLLYLFLLGVVFIIPVLYTRSLWLTGAMHWAGNTFFFVTHSVVQTEEGARHFSPNYLLATWLVLFIPLVWLFCKKATEPAGRRIEFKV